MRLVRLAILVLLAAVITAEPVVHTHPLGAQTASEANGLSTPNICGVCAVGTDRIIVDGPAVVPPPVVVERLVATTPAAMSVDAPLRAASRAPPTV